MTEHPRKALELHWISRFSLLHLYSGCYDTNSRWPTSGIHENLMLVIRPRLTLTKSCKRYCSPFSHFPSFPRMMTPRHAKAFLKLKLSCGICQIIKFQPCLTILQSLHAYHLLYYWAYANRLLARYIQSFDSPLYIALYALHEEILNERADITYPRPCIHQKRSVQTRRMYWTWTTCWELVTWSFTPVTSHFRQAR